MAERILLNEYKVLSKEPWTHIEVCCAAVSGSGSLHA
jgi:hypothetical protein